MNKRITANIGIEVFNDLKAKANEVKTALPFLITMSPAEKKLNQNLGLNGISYGKAVSHSSRIHNQIVSREFEVESFDNEIFLHEQLNALYLAYITAAQSILDTRQMIGQSIMKQSNEVYAAIKRAAKKDSQYQAAADELASYYKRTKVKKTTVNEVNPQYNE